MILQHLHNQRLNITQLLGLVPILDCYCVPLQLVDELPWPKSGD